jgi:hypothetical protein
LLRTDYKTKDRVCKVIVDIGRTDNFSMHINGGEDGSGDSFTYNPI